MAALGITTAGATATAVPVPQLSPLLTTPLSPKSENMNSQILKSPLASLQNLPDEEKAELDYKLDEFPGARDVATPVGWPFFGSVVDGRLLMYELCSTAQFVSTNGAPNLESKFL
jgi:hypothetical protein